MVVVKTYIVETGSPVVIRNKVGYGKDCTCLHFYCESGEVTATLYKGNFEDAGKAYEFHTVTLAETDSIVIDIFGLATEYYWYKLAGDGVVQLAIK